MTHGNRRWARAAALLGPLVPPALLPLARRISGLFANDRLRFTGRYDDWESAAREAAGYDAPSILEHMADSTRSLRSRWQEPSPRDLGRDLDWRGAAILLRAAGTHGQKLHVVDFGGGLGNLYFRSRALLDRLAEVRWSIVEQPHFVARGLAEFATEELAFFTDLDEAWERTRPDVVILSGVVQYLPDPHSVVRKLDQLGASTVLIDRTPVIEGAADLIVVQRVPEHLHGASYPARLLARDRLLAGFSSYTLVAEYSATDGVIEHEGKPIQTCGFLLERRDDGTRLASTAGPRSSST